MTGDENIPYRTAVPSQVFEPESRQVNDEDNYDTLKAIYREFKDSMEGLDKWHAFDLKEEEMPLKEQIKAHQLAYDLVAPLFSTLETAIQNVDSKYRR